MFVANDPRSQSRADGGSGRGGGSAARVTIARRKRFRTFGFVGFFPALVYLFLHIAARKLRIRINGSR